MMQYHVLVNQNHRAADEHDKRTHRVLWVNDVNKAIADVGEDPITHQGRFAVGDRPRQYPAACRRLYRARGASAAAVGLAGILIS
jgi:hypothetical protein